MIYRILFLAVLVISHCSSSRATHEEKKTKLNPQQVAQTLLRLKTSNSSDKSEWQNTLDKITQKNHNDQEYIPDLVQQEIIHHLMGIKDKNTLLTLEFLAAQKLLPQGFTLNSLFYGYDQDKKQYGLYITNESVYYLPQEKTYNFYTLLIAPNNQYTTLAETVKKALEKCQDDKLRAIILLGLISSLNLKRARSWLISFLKKWESPFPNDAYFNTHFFANNKDKNFSLLSFLRNRIDKNDPEKKILLLQGLYQVGETYLDTLVLLNALLQYKCASEWFCVHVLFFSNKEGNISITEKINTAPWKTIFSSLFFKKLACAIIDALKAIEYDSIKKGWMKSQELKVFLEENQKQINWHRDFVTYMEELWADDPWLDDSAFGLTDLVMNTDRQVFIIFSYGLLIACALFFWNSIKKKIYSCFDYKNASDKSLIL